MAFFSSPSTCDSPNLELPKPVLRPRSGRVNGLAKPAAAQSWLNADESELNDWTFTLLAR